MSAGAADEAGGGARPSAGTIAGRRAIVTDIEGTTTSIAFVKDVLFPFARKHLSTFVKAHADEPEVRACLEGARDLAGDPSLSTDGVIAVLLGWIDEDRKATPLKTLQGLIWADGYASGELTSHVYDDAAERLRAWHAAGHALYVFSSGSIAAQKLLFGHTSHGDLTGCFSGWFDTTTGPKLEAASYAKIAAATGNTPGEVLFLSDQAGELDAAAAAGMNTACLDRGEVVIPSDLKHPRFRSFAEIEPDSVARAGARERLPDVARERLPDVARERLPDVARDR